MGVPLYIYTTQTNIIETFHLLHNKPILSNKMQCFPFYSYYWFFEETHVLKNKRSLFFAADTSTIEIPTFRIIFPSYIIKMPESDFVKILDDPTRTFRGSGDTDSLQKPEVENLVSHTL